MLVQFILILVIVAIGFLLISLLNVLVPTYDTSIDTSSYTWSTIQEESDVDIVEAWCIQNIYADDNYNTLC